MLKDRLSEAKKMSRENLKEWLNRKVVRLIKYHPSNRPSNLDNNPKLANAYTTKGFSLVLCADSEKAIPVLEDALCETGIKLVKIDCRQFSNRNSMVDYISQKTQFSNNGAFWQGRCDLSIPWDYILLLDHVETFDPIDAEENVNYDLRYCLRAVNRILKNDSHFCPPTIAIVNPNTFFSDELISELYTRSYANAFIYSE